MIWSRALSGQKMINAAFTSNADTFCSNLICYPQIWHNIIIWTDNERQCFIIYDQKHKKVQQTHLKCLRRVTFKKEKWHVLQ